MPNRVKIYINNREYLIETDESEEYTKSLSKKLNDKITETMRGSAISLVDASILVSLSCIDETVKQAANMDNIRAQVKGYVDDAGEARLKLDEAQKELRGVKSRVNSLEKEVATKTSQLDTVTKELELRQKMYEQSKQECERLNGELVKLKTSKPTVTAASTTASAANPYLSSKPSSPYSSYKPGTTSTTGTTTEGPAGSVGSTSSNPSISFTSIKNDDKK